MPPRLRLTRGRDHEKTLAIWRDIGVVGINRLLVRTGNATAFAGSAPRARHNNPGRLPTEINVSVRAAMSHKQSPWRSSIAICRPSGETRGYA
jgi:hypothetical protein